MYDQLFEGYPAPEQRDEIFKCAPAGAGLAQLNTQNALLSSDELA